MEPATYENIMNEFNNASDDRDDIKNMLNRIIKHLNIKEEPEEEFKDELDNETDFDL